MATYSPNTRYRGRIDVHRIDSSSITDSEGSPSAQAFSGVCAIPAEICELCFSDLIQPVDAVTNAAGSVRMTLRCPECHHVRVGECSWEEAREFGRHFARGRAELRETYSEISQENLKGEAERLAHALNTGLIGPDDFKPFRYSG